MSSCCFFIEQKIVRKKTYTTKYVRPWVERGDLFRYLLQKYRF